MSTTIDQRVVSLQFDNKQFERNTATTMSTLDKLKEKLTFNKASKGLEDVGIAAKNVNMTGLGSGVEAVTAKFSALQVMGITALANITNSAVNAGKRMVRSLTVEPVGGGFKEYEMMLNAVQTTMAGTGKTAEEVQQELKKLDEYADKTVYSTADMLNNLPKFTNAGVALEDATQAMIGIANATALAGGDAGKASIAFYNLGQAIGTGYLTRMDYNSINNAGIATMEWKEQMVEAAVAAGTLTKKADGTYQAGKKTFTLQQLFIDGLQEQWATTEVMMKVFGDYGDEQTEIGKKAYSAAQDIKTFTMMMESLKATAETGWKDTWQLLFGDLDEAKEFWTSLTNTISGVITRIADWRNRILQVALDFSAPWKAITEKIGKVSDVVSKVTGTLEYFQDVVDKVWLGKFNNWGDNPDRRDLLKKAGYDPKVVQYLVNLGEEAHKAGKTYKLTAEDVAKAHEKYGKTVELTAEETEDAVDAYNSLSDAQLKKAKLTEDEIRLYRALEEEAKKHNTTVSKLAEEMSKADGRTMLIDSFKNVGKLIGEIAGAAKEALHEIFDVPSAEVLGVRLYGAIRSLKEFTESLTIVDKETGELTKNGENIKSIFEGLFAAIDIVVTLTAGPLKFVFKMVTQLCKVLGISVLDVAGGLGEFIVKIRDGIDGALDFTKIFEKIVPPIKNALSTFKDWIAKLKESKDLPKDIAVGIATGLKKAWTAVKNFFKNLPENISNGFAGLSESPLGGFVDKLRSGCQVAVKVVAELGKMVLDRAKRFLSRARFEEISADTIAGLAQGLRDKASSVWDAAVAMVADLVQKVKDFLGIHSPSTVFIAIGGFIVAGLIGGITAALQNGEGGALQGFKDFFAPIIEWVKNLDLGQIFAAFMGTGLLITVKKAVDALSAIATPFEGLGEVFEGVGDVLKKNARPIKKVVKSTSKVLNGFAKELKAEAFKTNMEGFEIFVKSLVLLIAAIIVLTFFDPKKIWAAFGLVAALGALLVGLVWLMGKINTASASFDLKNGFKIDGLMSGLLGIGVAVLLLGTTVKMLGKLDPEQAKQGFQMLIGMILGLVALVRAFALLDNGDAGKIGGTLFKMAAAIAIMAIVAKMLGGLEQGVFERGALAITAFSLILVGLMAATKFIGGGDNVDKIGGVLLSAAGAIAIMALVIKLLADLPKDSIHNGIDAILAFSLIIVGLMAATRLIGTGDNVDKIGGTILKIGVAIGIMALVVKLLGNMNPEDINRGCAAILAFSLIIVGLMAATRLAGGKAKVKSLGNTILAIAGAIAILAIVAMMLGAISWTGFAKGASMIGVLSIIVSGLVAVTRLAGGKNLKNVGACLIAIAGAIGILALIAVILGFVPLDKLAIGVVAVGFLSAMMAGLIAVTKLVNKDSMASLIVLAGIVAILGGVLITLSCLEPKKVGVASLALSAVIGMTSLLVFVAQGLAKVKWTSLVGPLATLVIVTGLLALVITLMVNNIKNPESALTCVAALLALVGGLTLLMFPLALLGIIGTPALYGALFLTAFVGILTLVVLAFGGLVAVGGGGLITKGIAAIQELADGIAVMIAAFTEKITAAGLLNVLAVFAMMPLLIAGISLLLPLMLTIGALATAIGALTSHFPQLEEFLNVGLPILVKLAGGIGEMIGAFVGGIITEIASTLPQLGIMLGMFMVNATPFIMGAKMVDEKVLAGVGILAGAIIALTAADLIAGVASFLQGGSSFAVLGTQLSMFMLNAIPFILGASMISEDMLSGVKMLADTILVLTAANVIEGLTSWLTGGSSLEGFAEQLPLLGAGLAAFSTSLGSFTEEQMMTVKCAAEAVKTLSSAAAEIPNSGGLLASLVGENDLGVFAGQFPFLGRGLRGFLDNVGVFTEEQVTTVNCASAAIKSLAEASSEIPNSGGWLGAIVGENDLSTFAEQFPALGTGLRGFVDNIGTFTEDQNATVDCAANAIKSLAEAAKEIPNEGGWVGKIVGENNLGTFAENFPALGTGLAGFLTNIGTFSEDQATTVDCAANAVKALALAAKDIPNEGGWISKLVGDNNLSTFASNFPSVGEGIKGFVDKLGTFTTEQVSTVYAGVSAIRALTGLAGVDLDGLKKNISGFGKKLPDFAENLSSFCTNMPSSDSVTTAVTNIDKLLEATKKIGDANSGVLKDFANNLKKVGEDAVKKFVGAFTSESAKKDLKSAANTLAAQAPDGADDKKGAMMIAGNDLGSGLVNGIDAKQDAVYWAGYRLGQKAVEGEKDGQQSNSPSKLAIQSGNWFGEGLVIGIDEMGRAVYSSGYALGETAVKSTSSAISRIADAINTDIDAQPTIRPIMDLSDVRAGANTIGSLLNTESSIGVVANAGRIGGMMNRYSQNRGNDDVVAAIDNLNKRMDNLGNTTYSINSITYDDESTVSAAVQSLVRAARIERRT